jgi:MFS family permease
MPLNRSLLPWFMWLFPLSFFGFQFILRLFPGLILNEFIEKYAITATDFGLFASLYYLGYAGMQIPMAVCLDKFGARKVISFCALLCGVATLMFVIIPAWPIALLSRFLIGAGSVVGFLGASKVISQWFPKAHYARLVGLTFSFGLLGAVYGGRPVSQWIAQLGWEKVSLFLGGTAIVVGLLTLVFLKNKEDEKQAPPPFLSSMKMLLANKSILMLAFANLLMVGALEGFADVWGVSYLMEARNLTKMDASGITSYIFIGMLFGGPILGYFSEKLNAHHWITMLCGVSMSLVLGSVLLMNGYYSDLGLKCAMIFIGILCCYQVIVFAIGTNSVPRHLISLTVAFLNCINMLGGSFFHSIIGRAMDSFSMGHNGYSLEAYTMALMIIPIASFLGAVLVVGSRWMEKSNKVAMQYA